MTTEQVGETRDGAGCGDHDLPFQYGHQATAAWPYPFTERMFARLLILRGHCRDHTGPIIGDADWKVLTPNGPLYVPLAPLAPWPDEA